MTSTHRITTTAAVLLSLAAAGAPAATARPDFAPAAKQPSPTAYSRPDKSLIPLTTPNGNTTSRPASAPQAVVQVETPPSGFDWGDAGIGAAGGLALAMLGVGGGLVISHQRPRRTRTTTSLPKLTSQRRAAFPRGSGHDRPSTHSGRYCQADGAAGSTRLCSPFSSPSPWPDCSWC